MTSLPLALVHSLGGRASFWDEVRRAVPASTPTHAFDLPGHGSALGTLAQSLDDFTTAVLRSADAAGLASFVLVGHSFGALVALAAAVRAPARVEALALVDAAGSMNAVPAAALEDFLAQARGPAGREFVAQAYEENLERATPATKVRVLESLADTDTDAIVAAYTALFGSDPLALLSRYPGPVRLIVDAANDSPMALHAQYPGLDIVPVQGTSHWIPLDQPGAVAAALAGWPAPGGGAASQPRPTPSQRASVT